MSDLYILASCVELQEAVFTAQRRLAEANVLLKKAYDDLAEAVRKRGSSIIKQEQEELNEIIERTKRLVSSRIDAEEAAREALRAAIANFKNAGLTTCQVPPKCETSLTKDLFAVNVAAQTTPLGNLPAELAAANDEKDKLQKRIIDLKECLRNLRARDDWERVRYNTNGTWIADFGLPSEAVVNLAGLQQIFGAAGWKGTNDTPCAPGMGDGYVTILQDIPNRWKGMPLGSLWPLLPTSIGMLVNLTNKVRKDLEERLSLAEKNLEDTEKVILALQLEIQDRQNPNSVKNRRKTSDMIQAGNRIIERCLQGVEYTVVIVITATAGPMAPPAGEGGVSFTIEGDAARNCVQADADGVLTLDKNRAAANLPQPGGCDKEDAFWKYPVNITATVTFDTNKLMECIGVPPQIKASDHKGSSDGTITLNHPGSVTLTACISNPDK